MVFSAWITLIFGFLVLIGGIMGHIKAHSRISLISGILFGVLLLLSSLGLFRGMKIGAYGALALTFILLLFFSWRFFGTFKFFPSAFMGILSLVVLILLILNLKKDL